MEVKDEGLERNTLRFFFADLALKQVANRRNFYKKNINEPKVAFIITLKISFKIQQIYSFVSCV